MVIASIMHFSLWKLCRLTNSEKLPSSVTKASFMLPTVTFECMETHNGQCISSMEEIKCDECVRKIDRQNVFY